MQDKTTTKNPVAEADFEEVEEIFVFEQRKIIK